MLHERPALDPRLAALVVGISCVINLVAMGVMVTVLRPGTPLGGDTAVRMTYISGATTGWVVGWGVWMCATLSLLAVFLVMVDTFRRLSGWLATLVIVIATIGVLTDLLGDLVMMTVLPEYAHRFATDVLASQQLLNDFELWDRIAVALTGGFANSAYGIVGLLLLPGMVNSKTLPRSFVWWAAAVWTVTVLASATLAAFSPQAAEPVFGAAMLLYVTWAGGMVTWFLHRAKEEFAEQAAPARP